MGWDLGLLGATFSSISSSPLSRGFRRKSRLTRAVTVVVEALENRTLFGATPYDGDSYDPLLAYAPPSCPPPTGPPQASLNYTSPGHPAGTSTGPVNYFTGMPSDSVTDLESDGFGQPWGVTRQWMGEPDGSLNGNGWVNTSTPYLCSGKTTEAPRTPPLFPWLLGDPLN